MWTFAIQNELFDFKTIDVVLEENQKLKEEVKWLNDVITNNISYLAEQIASVRAEHSEDITSVKTEFSEKIDDVKFQIGQDIVRPYHVPELVN